MSISSEIARLSKNISDSLDAVSAKGVTVPSGSTSDDLAGLIAQITGGGGATVVTTPDSHGGDIVAITTNIDLSNDTVTADTLLSGYTAHDATGQAITGTYVPKSDFTYHRDAQGYIVIDDDGSGGTSVEDALITGGSLEYVNYRVTTLGTAVFAGWRTANGLKLSLPNCTSIKYSFFVSGAPTNGFIRANFPSLRTISTNSCFRQQKGLQALYLPELTTCGQETFKEMTGISCDMVFPKMTSVTSVQQFQSLGTQNGGITVNIYMPALTSFNFSNSFQNCNYTKIIDFGSANGTIGAGTFTNCYILDTIILRRTAGVVALGDTAAFTSTPFLGYNGLKGTIYVPSALVSQYTQATNWSTLYNNGTCDIKAIEGSDYENLDYTALAAPAKAVQEDWL